MCLLCDGFCCFPPKAPSSRHASLLLFTTVHLTGQNDKEVAAAVVDFPGLLESIAKDQKRPVEVRFPSPPSRARTPANPVQPPFFLKRRESWAQTHVGQRNLSPLLSHTCILGVGSNWIELLVVQEVGISDWILAQGASRAADLLG